MVSFSEFDSCTDEFTSIFEIVPNPDFEQSRTDSATLNLSLELIEESSGKSRGVLDVALEFTGVGPVSNFKSRSTFSNGEVTFKFKQNGESRQAALAGSITLDGSELIDNVQFADLSFVRQGDMTVAH